MVLASRGMLKSDRNYQPGGKEPLAGLKYSIVLSIGHNNDCRLSNFSKWF